MDVMTKADERPYSGELNPSGAHMVDDADFVDELLNMAKQPDSFSKFELGEMILVAATEIIKLREQYPRKKIVSRQLPFADYP